MDFHQYLKNNSEIKAMPFIDIPLRSDDVFVTYNKNRTRLDRIAGDIYEDETLWKIILWANPDYSIEFDIPDNTPIRVPLPKNEVIKDIIKQINEKQQR